MVRAWLLPGCMILLQRGKEVREAISAAGRVRTGGKMPAWPDRACTHQQAWRNPALALAALLACLMPKSPSLRMPAAVQKTFEVLTSRWMMP